MDRVHHFVHQRPDLFLRSPIDQPGKLAVAVILYHGFRRGFRLRSVGVARERPGVLLFPEQLPAYRVESGQLDGGVCIWVPLPLTFGDRLLQIFLGVQVPSRFPSLYDLLPLVIFCNIPLV